MFSIGFGAKKDPGTLGFKVFGHARNGTKAKKMKKENIMNTNLFCMLTTELMSFHIVTISYVM